MKHEYLKELLNENNDKIKETKENINNSIREIENNKKYIKTLKVFRIPVLLLNGYYLYNVAVNHFVDGNIYTGLIASLMVQGYINISIAQKQNQNKQILDNAQFDLMSYTRAVQLQKTNKIDYIEALNIKCNPIKQYMHDNVKATYLNNSGDALELFQKVLEKKKK